MGLRGVCLTIVLVHGAAHTGDVTKGRKTKRKRFRKKKRNTVSVTVETRNYLQTPVNPSKAMCTSEPSETMKQITILISKLLIAKPMN